MSGVHRLKFRLIEARGSRTRPEIADLALEIPGSDPDFSPDDIVKHEHGMRSPTPNGLKLRTHLAALGIPLAEGLLLIGDSERLAYWPDLIAPGVPADKVVALRRFCEQAGVQVAHYDPTERRMVLQL